MHGKPPQHGYLTHNTQWNTSVWALHRQRAEHLKGKWKSQFTSATTVKLTFQKHQQLSEILVNNYDGQEVS